MSDSRSEQRADVPMAASEPMAGYPLWLAYSGLPELLNQQINRSAWHVLKTVIEIDCSRNARPRTVEVAPSQLAMLTGLDAKHVMGTLESLRKKKYIALFLPEHPEENALIEVKEPLRTPRSAAEVRLEFPFNRMQPSARMRYGSVAKENEESADETQQGSLQRVIDLYFDSVGFRMNTFILDELRLICQRFNNAQVEKAFARARKNDIRSLSWVVKDLYRISKLHERGKK